MALEVPEPDPRLAGDLTTLRSDIDRILLGGARKYTRLEVADLADVRPDTGRALWRALGFADVGDEDPVFTDADVDALRGATALVDDGVIDPETMTSISRMLGQTMGRLSEWQGRLLFHVVARSPQMLADPGSVSDFVEDVLPRLEQIQSFVWRRHLAAFTARALTQAGEDYETQPMVVGFADMTGFTSLTRRVSETELADLLEQFESVSSDVVTGAGGRIIKALGDEVLFVAGSAQAAAEIGLQLAERADTDEQLPDLRIGMAYGQVLARFGDVYGSVVNIASRLTSAARPGYVLVDRDLAEQLGDIEEFRLRPKRPISVRGYNHLQPFLLRRAQARPDHHGRRAHRSSSTPD